MVLGGSCFNSSTRLGWLVNDEALVTICQVRWGVGLRQGHSINLSTGVGCITVNAFGLLPYSFSLSTVLERVGLW